MESLGSGSRALLRTWHSSCWKESVREGEILQGKYRVERVIGRGGMGEVVAAHHLQLDTKVAIKTLLPQGLRHAESLLRFEREARAAVKIKSEHVARVLDVARLDDGRPYLVMEYLEGRDLSEWLRTRGPLPVEQAVELIVQACDAIGEAHSLGIVHRDLKPANLFVVEGRDGARKVKVLDFGISKIEAPPSGQAAMTRTRSVLGSPEYMSPEQYTGPKTVDARTDIWSLGATLFELLTGRAPFPGDQLVELAYKIIHEPAPRIEALRPVPPALSLVIQRCLEKDRAARYQNIGELVAALAPFAPSRRVAEDARAFALAATAFAQPAPSWPPQHRAAWESAPTEIVLRPLVASIPAPALEPRKTYGLVTALAAIAGVLVMLSICAVCLVVGRKPATAAAPPVASTSAPVEAVTPAPVPPPPPAPPAPTASAPVFRGTHAVTRARWVLGGGAYNGVVHTNGATGYVDVHTVEPGVGPVVIHEDLKLQRGPRGWTYVASNPRYADDGSPADFIPNVFYLEQSASGAWTFVETCASGTNMCARVQSGS
jgi:serine/threonine-protein kinase